MVYTPQMKQNHCSWQSRLPALIFFLSVLGCGAPGTEGLDTITSGSIRIGVDEALEPLISTGIYNFTQINPEASIDADYLPESEAYALLADDSVRLVIGGRKLLPAEEKMFEQKKLTPRYTPLAVDAIAFLVHPSLDTRSMTRQELQSVFSGAVSTWPTLGLDIGKDSIYLVFDHPGSGTITAMRLAFGLDALPPNSYALENYAAVVDYVAANPNAIGIVANNWIETLGATARRAFEAGVRVLGVGNETRNPYALPEQTFIADSTYPFVRTIYGISREPRVGLGTGFLSFLAGERGQRIVLKSGLLPVAMPSRELIIYDN